MRKRAGFSRGAGGRLREGSGGACLPREIQGREIGARRIGRDGRGFSLSAKGGKAGDELDRLVEDLTELVRGPVSDGFEGGQAFGTGHFPFEARDRTIGDAAGVDEGEVAEIGGDVEGEAVGGNAAGDVDADGGNFAACRRQTAFWMRFVVGRTPGFRRRCPTEARTRRLLIRRCGRRRR